MTPTRNDAPRGAHQLAHRLAGFRGRVIARREHDAAMQDPRIAAEHSFQVSRATSRGEAGCEFCR